jgi:predicted ATPase
MLKSLRLSNLLSFGPDSPALPLRPLNVLIGANGSGKSNVFEALGLLQAAPHDLTGPVSEGGGIREWLWKGSPPGSEASIEVVIDYPSGPMPLRYRLALGDRGQRLEVTDERIECERPQAGESKPYFFFGYESGSPMLNVRGGTKRALKREDVDPSRSILSQRQDPDQYPELTFLGGRFASIRFFREWNLGRHTEPRLPQRPDLGNSFLMENGQNLGLVLNRLRKSAETKGRLREYLRAFYAEMEDVDVSIEGGAVQVFVQERGWSIPATRLSDGTLHWLSLLAILLDRNPPGMLLRDPPALLCIEEPEIGLHPDMIPVVAKLLTEASQHVQIIAATHSDALIDALSDTPECVVIFEKREGQTAMSRLDKNELAVWLQKYRLGELWRKGEIGGNRW